MTFAAGGLAFWMPRYVFQDRGLYKDLGDAGLGKNLLEPLHDTSLNCQLSTLKSHLRIQLSAES